MSPRNVNQPDGLEDFKVRNMTFETTTKRVFCSGTGPAVVVIAEIPGISPHVARFSRWVRDAGFTVYMPSLFGRDGAIPSGSEGKEIFERACISHEFKAFASNESSPVTSWLRGLAKLAHQECGGPGVGAVGMCFTGNFALSMMLEPAVVAPVMCEPSLPLDNPSALAISTEEISTIAERMKTDQLTVLGYRFEGDSFCRAERFAAYSDALGDQFIGRVLPDSAGNTKDLPPFTKEVVGHPHSVVTTHLIDEIGEPTLAARDEIIAFFKERLLQ
ncbi:dienelactone hydrolase family protein [Synechococcus sp. MIT S1220]|uniref:dienelactone hydrolase family protein n=1 Tax=Synechococcus sp. MIT S1220 TaxID=3082549 RepID=UPI0039AF78CC